MKMTIYAYFRKFAKSTSVILCLKLSTKRAEVYTCWQGIPHADDSFGKKTYSEYCCCCVI